MADSRYVIELILNARDNTAGAFQKALGQQKKFVDQQIKDNERLASSIDELERTSKSYETENSRLLNNQKDNKRVNDETLKAQEELTIATREYVKLKKQVATSESEEQLLNNQKLKALSDIKEAEDAYSQALQDHEKASESSAKTDAKKFRQDVQDTEVTRARAKAIRDLVIQREEIIDSIRKEAEVAKKTKAVDKEKHDQAVKNIGDLKKQYESLKTSQSDAADATDRLARAEQQGMAVTKADIEDLSAARKRHYDLEQRRQELVQKDTSGMTQSQKVSLEIDQNKVATEAAAARATAEAILAFINVAVELDLDDASVAILELEKKALATDITIKAEVELDRNGLVRTKRQIKEFEDAGSPIKNLFTAFSRGFNDSSGQLSRVSGSFRGLLILGLLGFLGQLASGVLALSASLVALVSSALSAAGALGGALVAGIGQALPAVGVLAAFGNRLSKVFGALKQSNLEQQQASYMGANAANTQAKSLSGVADAQKALTEARKTAKKTLEDLIFAEKGQALSAEEAGFALQKAISSGGSMGVARAQLGVESANRDLAGTRSQISTRKKSGIEGSPEVVAALKNVQQAQQSAAQAGGAVLSAAGKLNFLLAGLSASEVKLYKALMRLQTAWRKFAENITAPLTNSFTFAVNRVVKILDSKQILDAGKRLSTTLGASFTQIFDALFSKDTVTRFLALGEEFAKNLKPITGIAISLLNIFLNFAEAGGPALSLILGYLNNIIGSLDKWSSSIAGKKSLTDFFTEGSGSLKGILDLLMAIGNVILAIMGPAGGIKAGNVIIQQMVDGLNNFAEAIKDPTSRVGKFFTAFFEAAKQTLPILKPLLSAIGGLIEQLVSEKAINSLNKFVSIITKVIVPSIKQFIFVMQILVNAFESFAAIPIVSTVLSLIVSFSLLRAVLRRFSPLFHGFREAVGTIKAMSAATKVLAAEQALYNATLVGGGKAGPVKPVGKIGKVIQNVPVLGNLAMGAGRAGGAEELAKRSPEGSRIAALGEMIGPKILSPWTLIAVAIAAVIAAVVGLIAYSGRLGDVWKQIKKTFNEVWASIKKGAGDIAKEITGKNSIKEAFSDISKFAKKVGNALADAAIWLTKAYGYVAKKQIEALVQTIIAVVKAVKWTIQAFKDVKSWTKEAGTNIGNFFDNILSAIIQAAEGAVNTVIGAVKKIADTFNSLPAWARLGKTIDVSGLQPVNFETPNEKNAKQAAAARSDRRQAQQQRDMRAARGDQPATRASQPEASGTQRRTPGKDKTPAKDKSPAKVKAATKVDNADANSFLNTFDPQTVQLSDAIVKKLSRYWHVLRQAAKNSVNDVIDFLKDLRGAKGNGRIDKFVTSAISDFKRLRSGVRVNMVGVSNIVKNQMQNSMNAVHDAAVYMKKTLNDALKSVGADKDLLTIKIGAAPKVTGDAQAAATGGWIGNRGERGQDAVHAILGRGEAVLNWGQQKVVEPALRQVYGFGLDEMFGRTRSAHAGTGRATGGFARGGRSGRGQDIIATVFGSEGDFYDPEDARDPLTAAGKGYRGDNMRAIKWVYGEIADSALGHLARGYKLKVSRRGKSAVLGKYDINSYNPGDGRKMDIWIHAARYLSNFQKTGMGTVHIEPVSQSAPLGPTDGSGGGDAATLKMPKITGGKSPLGQLVTKGTKKMIDGANAYLAKKTPSGGAESGGTAVASGSGGPAGLGNFDGFQVAKWIIPILTWARQHGWKGSITSGYRSHAHNVAQGRNYHSNHEDTAYPGGAIDVGGYGAVAEGQALANVLKGYRGPRNLVWGTGIKDYGHFSARGNAKGGFVGIKKFAAGGMTAHTADRPSDSRRVSDRELHDWYYSTYGSRYKGIVGNWGKYRGMVRSDWEHNIRNHRTGKVQDKKYWTGMRKDGIPFGGYAQGGFAGLQRFANGGNVMGPDGQAVPIVAHAGEWVVNKMQQAKLAMMAGTTTDRVKGALGFSGGPTSFAKGGEVKELTSGTLQAVAENAPSKLEDFTTKINQAFNETFSFIDKQINKNLGNLNSKKFSKNLESMLVSIRKLTNDGGALDALALRITRTFDLATTSANLAIAGFVKVGNKLKKVTTGKDFENAIDPEKIATAEALLQKELQDKLIILRTEWVRSLARINKIIKQSKLGSATRINDDVDKIQADIDKLEKGDENADQKKKIKKLEKRLKEKKKQLTDRQKLDGEKNTAEDKIKGIEDQISETESKQVELLKTAFEERTKADTKTSDATIKQSTYLKSVGELLSSFGGDQFGQTGQDLVTKSLADNKQAAIDRQTALNKRLEDAKKLAAADPRFQSLADDLADQVNEANLAVLQAMADEGANAITVLQKGIEDKIKSIDTKAALENISKSIGELIGNNGMVSAALDASLANANRRKSELEAALAEATAKSAANPDDPRWKELVTTLTQQLADAGLSVYEANAAIIQNAIDATDKVFQRGEFIRGISERGAALAERMGNRSGAFATRQSNLAGRGADLQSQRDSLQALLSNPAIAGNAKQIEELANKIKELDASIAENSQETKDLSLEYRKSQVDLITGRSDRTTGLIGSAGGIIANIARATGSSQSLESQIGLAEQIKTALGLEQGGLADQISKAIADQQLGSEANAVLAQLQTAFSSGDPASFAATLAALSPTIAELDSTLGVTAAGTFQTLINAMISNTTATTDNTANLAELNGLANQPQQFATTAWTKFRTALFNGVGDILPQFQIPQMATGGAITKGGLFQLHPGEFVVNATQSNLPSDSPINITVNEANKPLDVTALASRIAFEKRTRR